MNHPYQDRPVAGTHVWLTPPDILSKLGEFDLDPCASKDAPWLTARNSFTEDDDGLSKDWSGRVWLNPPYGQNTRWWLKKMADHNDGVALVFARTDTSMFTKHVWPYAHAMLFVRGRPHFHHQDGTRAKGNCGGPLVLIAYGESNAYALRVSGIEGHYLANVATRTPKEQTK